MSISYIDTSGGRLAVEVEGEGPLDHRGQRSRLAAITATAGLNASATTLRQ